MRLVCACVLVCISGASVDAYTVHVTSYLNFAAEILGLPSRNSVNAREISTEHLHPLCRLAAGTYQLWNTFLGIRLSRVGGETVCTLLVKAA